MKPLFRFTLSTLIIIGLGTILLFLAVATEMFQNKNKELDLADIYTTPLTKSTFKKIKSIKLINKNGEFLILNQDPSGELSIPWQLQGENKLEVKVSVIEKIFECLENIRIRNFHRLEPINLTSFSINNPTMEFHFVNTKNETTKILMGLINPIDNSAYVTIGQQKQIYQIDPLRLSLENYDIQDLTSESTSYEAETDNLLSLEIYQAKGLLRKIVKKDTSWLDSSGNILNEKKVLSYLQSVEKLKTISPLTNLSQEQINQTLASIDGLTYQFKLISDKNVRSYIVSKMTKTNQEQMKGKYLLYDEDKTTFAVLEDYQIKVLDQNLTALK